MRLLKEHFHLHYASRLARAPANVDVDVASDTKLQMGLSTRHFMLLC